LLCHFNSPIYPNQIRKGHRAERIANQHGIKTKSKKLYALCAMRYAGLNFTS
jgi:hypothetical protein